MQSALTSHASASGWDRSLYAFLAEKQQRSGFHLLRAEHRPDEDPGNRDIGEMVEKLVEADCLLQAGRLRIRVVMRDRGLQEVRQHGRTGLGDGHIVLVPVGIEPELVLEPGTAAPFDADAQHRSGRLAAKNMRDTARGSFADGNCHGKCCP